VTVKQQNSKSNTAKNINMMTYSLLTDLEAHI